MALQFHARVAANPDLQSDGVAEISPALTKHQAIRGANGHLELRHNQRSFESEIRAFVENTAASLPIGGYGKHDCIFVGAAVPYVADHRNDVWQVVTI